MGPARLQDFESLSQLLEEDGKRRRYRRLLVNLLGVEGTPTFTEQFRIGEFTVRHLSHLERVASVVPRASLSRTSEKVAKSQGANLRVFTSFGEAMAWLAS